MSPVSLTGPTASTKLPAMSEYLTREDGRPYESGIVAETVCAYCGESITQRAEGRRRLFCDATCRSGSYRKSRPSKRVTGGNKRLKRV